MALAALGAFALLPAGASAGVITTHPVTPTVITPTAAPTPAAQTGPAPAPPAPAPAPTYDPAPSSSPQPTGDRANSQTTWPSSSKPGWEGVKATHDAIDRAMGTDLLSQTLTQMTDFQSTVEMIDGALDSVPWMPTLELSPHSDDPDLLDFGVNLNIRVPGSGAGDRDNGIYLELEDVAFGAHGADPGGIKEIIDGVFGTNSSDQLKRLKKQ